MGIDGVFSEKDVMIEGDAITGVGVDLKGENELFVCGRYLTPGFIDGHNHLGLEEEIYGEEGDDVNELGDPVSAHLRAADGINPWDVAFQDAVRAGVTRCLVVPGSANVIGGQGAVVRTCSPLYHNLHRVTWGVKAALGENPKRVYGQKDKSPMTRMASAALLREALFMAREMACQEGELTRERYRLLPLVPVVKGEAPLWVHAHRADDIMTAVNMADEFGIRVVIQHGTEAHLVANELKERKIPVVVGPLMVNRAKVEMKEVSLAHPRRLWEAGIDFCFMTDHPVVPVSLFVVQAALAVREGLPEEVALQAMTIGAASILGLSEELGSIEVGKKADLVLWSGHPLDFRSRPEAVWIDGIKVGGVGCE